MNEKEKELVAKLLADWYHEARGNIYERSGDFDTDFARLDAKLAEWKRAFSLDNSPE